jgi:hypothetical protein
MPSASGSAGHSPKIIWRFQVTEDKISRIETGQAGA